MLYLDLFNYKSSLIFFLILIINLLILNFRNNFAKFLNIYDHPNERKIHKFPTPLVGGICLFFTISIALTFIFFQSLVPQHKIIIFTIFCLVFFVVGLLDDSKTLSPKIKTLVIIFTLVILLPFENDFIINELNFKSSNITIDLHNFSFIFTMFCIFALYNALNFIDGYNGSAISIIIFWTFILLLKNPNLLYVFLIINVLLVFFYNLYGKVFLGNSGTSLLSIFFSLSIINDYNVIQTLFADEILLLLLFPGIDMIRVTFERVINKKKIYFPDKTHFHHYLIKIKFKYIWQSIFILTVLPLIIFYTLNKFYLTLIISILIYLILFLFLREKQK